MKGSFASRYFLDATSERLSMFSCLMFGVCVSIRDLNLPLYRFSRIGWVLFLAAGTSRDSNLGDRRGEYLIRLYTSEVWIMGPFLKILVGLDFALLYEGNKALGWVR